MYLSKDNPETVGIAGTFLGSGKVGVIACDTIYGICGRVPDTEGRIRDIKGREDIKPFIILFPDIEGILEIAASPLDPVLTGLWPGPLTVIIPKRGGGTVGVRIPDDEFTLSILRAAGIPLYSTSVNRSGEAPLWRISEIADGFSGSVDFIVDGGDMQGKTASTIVDVTVRPYRIIRQGACVLPPSLFTASKG